MRRKIIVCALLGAPIGLTVCTVISILFSLGYGQGEYYPVPQDLTVQCGSEIRAVLLQTVFALLYGAAWGGASVIWEVERWSPLKMTLIHLAVCSGTSFPVAYCMQWMPHSVGGALGFFGLFFLIYALIWLVKFLSVRKQIQKINRELHGPGHGKRTII